MVQKVEENISTIRDYLQTIQNSNFVLRMGIEEVELNGSCFNAYKMIEESMNGIRNITSAIKSENVANLRNYLQAIENSNKILKEKIYKEGRRFVYIDHMIDYLSYAKDELGKLEFMESELFAKRDKNLSSNK